MPVSDLHRRVAALALAAAAEHGFALGGGNALLAHGVISRPTADVDLFTDQEHGVQAAADAVQAALRRAGFQAERQGQTGGLSDMFPDIGEGLAEWIVTAAAGEQMLLQLAYFGRGLDRVVMDIGPGPGSGRRRGREGVRAGPAASSHGTTPMWPLRWGATARTS